MPGPPHARRRAARAYRKRRLGVDHLAVHVAGIVLDEVEPVFGIAAHQLVHQLLDHRALFELGGRKLKKEDMPSLKDGTKVIISAGEGYKGFKA